MRSYKLNPKVQLPKVWLTVLCLGGTSTLLHAYAHPTPAYYERNEYLRNKEHVAVKLAYVVRDGEAAHVTLHFPESGENIQLTRSQWLGIRN